jgi:hypothetical protein
VKIAVALLTCDRYDYTERVLRALHARNNLDGMALVYADDNSVDQRIHDITRQYGFEPGFLNTGKRLGCSPMTDALWQAAKEMVGDDGAIISVQNDFECIRELPWGLIEDALKRPEVVCVKLWDAPRKGGRIGPVTPLLRRAKWNDDESYSEPVETARTGWGFGPIAMKAETACRIALRATREKGVMKQSVRLNGIVVRPKQVAFRHIGVTKTPRGIYRSRHRYSAA